MIGGPQQKVLGYAGEPRAWASPGGGQHCRLYSFLTSLVCLTGLVREQLVEGLDIVLFGCQKERTPQDPTREWDQKGGDSEHAQWWNEG